MPLRRVVPVPRIESMTRVLMSAMLLVVLLLATGGTALADPGPRATARPAGDRNISTPPYDSPMRDQCTEELRKDDRWRADLRNQLRDEIHEEDAMLMLRNKRHVVLAYASIWILSALFLVFIWRRQGRVRGEIEQLRRDVRRAAGKK